MPPTSSPTAERTSDSDRAEPSWFRARASAWRAVAVFLALMGLFYGFVHTPALGEDSFLASGLSAHLTLLTRLSAWLLGMVGQEVQVPAVTTLVVGGFPVRIVRGCDGLEPIAAFASAVLASPVGMRPKLPGLAAGVAALWLINLGRIVSLALIGAHFPKLFGAMHEEVWQVAFIALAIVFWAIWVQWATGEKAAKPDVST